MNDLTSMAVEELRSVAAFIDAHAGSIIGDMDETFIAENGLRFEFSVMEHDSIPTLTMNKTYFVMDKKA